MENYFLNLHYVICICIIVATTSSLVQPSKVLLATTTTEEFSTPSLNLNHSLPLLAVQLNILAVSDWEVPFTMRDTEWLILLISRKLCGRSKGASQSLTGCLPNMQLR